MSVVGLRRVLRHRNLRSPYVWAGVAAATTALVLGCGPTLDRISSLNNLRILGVKKSAPYAKPGETVSLKMLWEDGRESLPPKVETFFGFWCVNPPGDTYSQCLANPPSITPQFVFNQSEFDIVIPDDAVREVSRDSNLPPNGSAYVFYGACAGTLELGAIDPSSTSSEGLLPRCLDDAGKELGPDDFIVGYSQIFVYEELRNENPIVLGLTFKGEEVRTDCIGDACDSGFDVPDLSGCEDGVICLETCKDDGELGVCPSSKLAVVVDPASAEDDDLAKMAYGQDIQESIWVSYFIDRGQLSPEVKLVNDSERGFQEDVAARIYAPKDPGPVRVWAVVRDNRGGISWLRAPGYVRAKK